MHINERDIKVETSTESATVFNQGGHILAKMKFPVFSWVFPVLHKFSLCYFYAKLTISSMNKGHITTVFLHTEANKFIFKSVDNLIS